ncbi:MAG: RNA polymerase sigma factor, partial [Pseudonocardiaceae bacterium]
TTEYGRRSRLPVPVDLNRDDAVPFGILAGTCVEDAVVLRDSLGQAFGMLDDRFRTAVELVDVWGCPQAEAAELCGVPEATVRTRLWRARRSLRSTLAGDVA